MQHTLSDVQVLCNINTWQQVPEVAVAIAIAIVSDHIGIAIAIYVLDEPVVVDIAISI